MRRIATKPQAGSVLIENGQASPYLQNFFDDVEIQNNNDRIFPLGSLPDAGSFAIPDSIMVTGTSKSPTTVPAYTDGTDWRFFDDNLVVS